MSQHPASERKRRRLRAEGDVPSVAGLIPAGRLAGLLLGFWGLGPLAGRGVVEMVSVCLRQPDGAGVLQALPAAAWALGAAAGVIVCAVLGGTLFPWLVGGFLWVPVRFGGGLLPGVGLRPGRGAAACLPFFVAVLVLVAFRSNGQALAGATTPQLAVQASLRWLRALAAAGSGMVVATALAGYFWGRYEYEQRIMMTDDERRREQQEDAGSPAVRQQRDRLQAELLGGGGGPSRSAADGMVVMGGPEGPKA